MAVYPQTFSVAYRFDLHFTRDVFAPDQDLLATVMRPPGCGPLPARAMVYVDAGTAAQAPQLMTAIPVWFASHEAQGVQLAASPEIVAGGEAVKNDLAILDRVGRAAFEHGICRHSYIIIIGGGAVLDAVGFAASLVHRGIRQIRLPSTVLAQCDAGLGVKNGVNRFGAKNFYGTFTPPTAIINDARFLATLDDRSWRAGIAEAVKVAIIKDAAFLAELAARAVDLARRDLPAMEWLIERCARLHLAHITGAGDPFEQGSSRPLDFGHWSAHRLETMTKHRLLHGEAVAIGVAMDTMYAAAIGRIQPAEADAVLATLTACGFQLYDAALDLRDATGRRSIFAGLEQFREHLGGELTLAMPDGLGRRRDIHGIDEAVYEQCLLRLRRYRAAHPGGGGPVSPSLAGEPGGAGRASPPDGASA
jgi:3-dehydroquinate synthase